MLTKNQALQKISQKDCFSFSVTVLAMRQYRVFFPVSNKQKLSV